MIRYTGRTPMFIPPMLCDLLRDPARLDDSRYAAEPKCDGQRAQVLGMLPSSRLRHPVFVGEEARRRAPPEGAVDDDVPDARRGVVRSLVVRPIEDRRRVEDDEVGVRSERRPGHVPVDTGTASVPAGLDQAALTSIALDVAACGAGTLTSSMPFAYFASTWPASTASGRAKFRWNAPYATSRMK